MGRAWRLRLDKLSRVVKSMIGLYARAVPGWHRAGPGERGGGSYGRRAVATAEWAAMQISVDRKGLICRDDSRQACQRHARPNVHIPRPVRAQATARR